MKNKLVIIESLMSDDSDYSYGYDIAIHNTLDPYWEWTKIHNIPISFEKHTDNDLNTMALRLKVVAIFENQTDQAFFKLTFGKFPLTRLNQSLENSRFL